MGSATISSKFNAYFAIIYALGAGAEHTSILRRGPLPCKCTELPGDISLQE